MSLGEKIYTAFVILAAGFVLSSLASFHFIIIPHANSPGIYYSIASTMWLVFLALSITAGINIHRGQLLTIPTIIQGLCLCLMVYCIPIGIAGFVLLFKRNQRTNDLEKPTS